MRVVHSTVGTLVHWLHYIPINSVKTGIFKILFML
jgi:hypothetical protein